MIRSTENRMTSSGIERATIRPGTGPQPWRLRNIFLAPTLCGGSLLHPLAEDAPSRDNCRLTKARAFVL
jgi:hypothetical protein